MRKLTSGQQLEKRCPTCGGNTNNTETNFNSPDSALKISTATVLLNYITPGWNPKVRPRSFFFYFFLSSSWTFLQLSTLADELYREANYQQTWWVCLWDWLLEGLWKLKWVSWITESGLKLGTKGKKDDWNVETNGCCVLLRLVPKTFRRCREKK